MWKGRYEGEYHSGGMEDGLGGSLKAAEVLKNGLPIAQSPLPLYANQNCLLVGVPLMDCSPMWKAGPKS